jgi:hypothetical protein
MFIATIKKSRFICSWNDGFALIVFSFLEAMTHISHILISNERLMALDKNSSRVFKCEHTKSLGGFAQIGILIKAN